MAIEQREHRRSELSPEELAIANEAFAGAMKALRLGQGDTPKQEALARLIEHLVRTSNPRVASDICARAVRMSCVRSVQ